jgi:cytochrome c oxidase subunit 2
MKLHIDRYERTWMIISFISLAVLLTLVTIAGSNMTMSLPGVGGTIDPKLVSQTAPFDNPGVFEIEPGKYEVIIVAKATPWSFTPNEIRVKAGSTVTFKIASTDVTHGFLLEGTNANIMIIPGQISVVTVKFKEPGEHQFVCHEYCGVGHGGMFGKVIVEP